MKKKIIIFSIILITLTNTLIPVVNAAQIITKANLINDHKINTHLLYYNDQREEWRDIQCGYICYKQDGEKYPAYCIMPNTNGVDEEGSYTVTIDKLIDNKLIYNVLINGYPYKTPSQLGLDTADDAYVATKLALKNALLDRDVTGFYKAADTRGEKIMTAMFGIIQKGKNGNAGNKDANISINKVGTFKESGEYYYQEYSVSANVNVSEFSVKSIENFPEGTYIVDSEGNRKEKFSFGEKLRVMIPKSKLNKDIEGKINITASCNTNPIFYGKAPNAGIQDYAVTYKPYVDYDTSTVLSQNTNTASIKILKQDTETLKPIKDVTFGLYNKNDEYITSKTTNSEGIAIFDMLYQGIYKIKEIKANDNYVHDDTVYEINTEYNKEVIRTINNTHKKGNLKITKVDKDDNLTVLEGIEFELIDSNNKVIAHLVTDINGEVFISNINIGKYTLKETKTKENYNLCIDNNIEVKWNETSEIKIENEKKKGQIKIMKQDAENGNIKLKGVEFQIIDINNNVVDKVVTDTNGIGISSRLPIGEYIIKEVDLGENYHYILNEEEYKIIVEDEKVNEIVIENYHKKGNLKITKVDKDDKTITLGAIEFDLIDEEGNVISHLVTDVNGEVYLENINTGTYTLKETKTKREYNLCENTNIFVEWNKTSEVVIENEKKKGQIKIIKQDVDKEEIKLEGVKFQIIDINNKVVEEVITDNNGEAISSKLLIGEYKIKEIDLGNNTNYILNSEIYTVKVENQLITELMVKNKHKEGSLKIKKIDKDYSDIVLDGVKFEITDKDGFEYEAITNTDGIAQIDNIRVGNIKIKEIKTNEDYVLSQEILVTEIKYNECVEIKIENEKKKGQVEIYKTDKDNKNIKIPNVEFDILDINNSVVDKVITNEEGYAISKKLPIGKYYLKEIKTDNKYLLNKNVLKINIEYDSVLRLNIENEKIKGKIKIVKSSSNDSPILNIKQGDVLEGVEFEIFNSKNELVDRLITDESGQAVSKDLEMGRYKVIEKTTNQYYILNKNEFFVNIENNGEIKALEIGNEAVIPRLDIEKTGEQFAEKNEEVKYEFDIKNVSNTNLDNFTWIEYIPYEDCKVTKMVTGIYNENLDYEIHYKTDKNDYRLLRKVNTLASEYINFDDLNLEDEEIITEIKVEYGTVNKDFKSIVNPCIFVKIDNDVNRDDRIENITELSGNVEDYIVRDKSSFETVIIEKEILKKLPKTGC